MKAVILAGGKGTRMGDMTAECPKALCTVGGKPLLDYMLSTFDFLKPEDIVIVVKYQKEKILERYADRGYVFVDQVETLGTGHALLMTRDVLNGYRGPVVTAFCDMPLLSKQTLCRLLKTYEDERADAALLTALVHPIPKYGRIIRDENGGYVDIVEEGECTEEQKKIPEVHVGLNVYKQDGALFDMLGEIPRSAVKKEIYLTTLPTIYRRHNKKVVTCLLEDNTELWGVNDKDEMEKVALLLKQRNR